VSWSTLWTTVAKDQVQQDWATHMLAVWGHQPFVSQTSENIYTTGAQTWTPQKENNAEWRESFFLKQRHFSVNNDMQQH
jgi:hypothetical protein